MDDSDNYVPNPLLIGELDNDQSVHSSDEEGNEDLAESSRADSENENDYFVSNNNNDDEDKELNGNSEFIGAQSFNLPDPKKALAMIRAKHNFEDLSGDKLSSTWSSNAPKNSASKSSIPPPPSEMNKLTPLAVSKIVSKSEGALINRALPKSVALEKQILANRADKNLSPVFSVDPSVITTKNSFTTAAVLPPILSSTTSMEQSPRRDEVNELKTSLDSAREVPTLPAINGSHSNRESSTNQTQEETEVSSQESKKIRELKKLYKKSKEKNDYKTFHEFIEEHFKNFTTVASYFKSLKPSADFYDESCGLDLELLYTFCDITDRFPLDDTFRKVLLKNIVNILMNPPPQDPTMSKTDLQTYFILLHFPIFAELNTYVVFSYLVRQIATLKPPNMHQLVMFFNKAGDVSIRNVSKMVRKFVDKRFFPPSDELLPPSKECTWWIPSACKCLAMLFAANANQNAQPHLEIRAFYCRSMDHLELLEDFQSFTTGTPKRSFTFCQYSFVITTFAKRRLLSQANELEMLSAAKDNLSSQIRNSRSRDSANVQTALFVELSVQRVYILQDSIKEVVAKQKELKRKLRVKFIGEEGVDLGGLTKEWFLLLVPKIFGPQLGLFVQTSSKNIWFNGACKHLDGEFYLAGAILGLAIYNSIVIDAPLPVCLFKKLLSPPVSSKQTPSFPLGHYTFNLHDYSELEPEVVKNLSELLAYNGSVEEDFALDFCVSVRDDLEGTNKNYTLKKHGNKVKVTNQNRAEYVSRYLSFHLNEYVQKQCESFYRGFHSVCNSDVLSIIRAEELQNIICGEPILEVRVLKKSARYEGGLTSKDDLSLHLWQVVEEMKQRQMRRFLAFLTGSEKIPIGGAKDLTLRIRKVSSLSEDSLPVAHTCFNELQLPPYQSKEQLKQKLNYAINNTEGFNLK